MSPVTTVDDTGSFPLVRFVMTNVLKEILLNKGRPLRRKIWKGTKEGNKLDRGTTDILGFIDNRTLCCPWSSRSGVDEVVTVEDVLRRYLLCNLMNVKTFLCHQNVLSYLNLYVWSLDFIERRHHWQMNYKVIRCIYMVENGLKRFTDTGNTDTRIKTLS